MKRCSDYQGRAKVRPGTSCQRIVIVVLGCAFLQNLFNLLAVVARREEQSIKPSLVLVVSQRPDMGLHNIYEII